MLTRVHFITVRRVEVSELVMQVALWCGIKGLLHILNVIVFVFGQVVQGALFYGFGTKIVYFVPSRCRSV